MRVYRIDVDPLPVFVNAGVAHGQINVAVLVDTHPVAALLRAEIDQRLARTVDAASVVEWESVDRHHTLRRRRFGGVDFVRAIVVIGDV